MCSLSSALDMFERVTNIISHAAEVLDKCVELYERILMTIANHRNSGGTSWHVVSIAFRLCLPISSSGVLANVSIDVQQSWRYHSSPEDQPCGIEST